MENENNIETNIIHSAIQFACDYADQLINKGLDSFMKSERGYFNVKKYSDGKITMNFRTIKDIQKEGLDGFINYTDEHIPNKLIIDYDFSHEIVIAYHDEDQFEDCTIKLEFSLLLQATIFEKKTFH